MNNVFGTEMMVFLNRKIIHKITGTLWFSLNERTEFFPPDVGEFLNKKLWLKFLSPKNCLFSKSVIDQLLEWLEIKFPSQEEHFIDATQQYQLFREFQNV